MSFVIGSSENRAKRLRYVILQIFKDNYNSNVNENRTTTDWVVPRDPLNKINGFELPHGDLRFILPGKILLVNADRSGGITHLVRCWHFLEGICKKESISISLFYVFLSPSAQRSRSVQQLWHFACNQIKDIVGNRLEVNFTIYERPVSLDSHAEIPQAIINDARTRLDKQGVLKAFSRGLSEGFQAKRETNELQNVTG